MSICAIACVYANNGIPENYFTDNQGIQAADAGSPYGYPSHIPTMACPCRSDNFHSMWHFASGSCLPSAAEDGKPIKLMAWTLDGESAPLLLI